MIFAPKMPKSYVIIARKNIFSGIFFLGGGHVAPPLPRSPTPMPQTAWAIDLKLTWHAVENLQGSVATQLRCGVIFNITLLQIFHRVSVPMTEF